MEMSRRIEFLNDMKNCLHRLVQIIMLSAATNMKWIKAKMQELGVESNPDYKITFYMCSLAMITVHTQKYGVVNVSSCLYHPLSF